ncbi:MAG: hypothetical protein WDZ79_02995, partial [Candidatus Paceibacterota bacterium]
MNPVTETVSGTKTRIQKGQVCWLSPWLPANISFHGRRVKIKRWFAFEVDGVSLYRAELMDEGSRRKKPRELFVREDELCLDEQPSLRVINPHRLVRTLARKKFDRFDADKLLLSDKYPEYVLSLGARISRNDQPALVWFSTQKHHFGVTTTFFSAGDVSDPLTFFLYVF